MPSFCSTRSRWAWPGSRRGTVPAARSSNRAFIEDRRVVVDRPQARRLESAQSQVGNQRNRVQSARDSALSTRERMQRSAEDRARARQQVEARRAGVPLRPPRDGSRGTQRRAERLDQG